MKGYKINDNEEHVNVIIEGLKRKNGHCPCKIQETPENLCPCDEFINSGVCKCKLYIPEEEAFKMIEEKKLEQ